GFTVDGTRTRKKKRTLVPLLDNTSQRDTVMAVRFLVSITFMAVAIASFGVAKADRLPTEGELNAAYCLEVIQLFSIPFAEQARSNMMSAGALDQLDTAAKAKIDTVTEDEIKKARDGETLLRLHLL